MPSMHNAREGDMSEEELGQCLLDIGTWLQSKAGAIGADYAARASADEAALAQLPPAAPAALKVVPHASHPVGSRGPHQRTDGSL